MLDNIDLSKLKTVRPGEPISAGSYNTMVNAIRALMHSTPGGKGVSAFLDRDGLIYRQPRVAAASQTISGNFLGIITVADREKGVARVRPAAIDGTMGSLIADVTQDEVLVYIWKKAILKAGDEVLCIPTGATPEYAAVKMYGFDLHVPPSSIDPSQTIPPVDPSYAYGSIDYP